MFKELFRYTLKLILNFYFKLEKNLSWILRPHLKVLMSFCEMKYFIILTVSRTLIFLQDIEPDTEEYALVASMKDEENGHVFQVIISEQ